jgi:dTDP-4-dehydrorhamnose 3,5-epimerase
MHFQTPPHDHVKVVYCVHGEVFDVVVDLRQGSPTYQQSVIVNLSAEKANMIYIPRGMAHGFCAQSEIATLVYKVETIHNADHDAGILWSSVGVQWPVSEPVVSERDRSFVDLKNFQSPFFLSSSDI